MHGKVHLSGAAIFLRPGSAQTPKNWMRVNISVNGYPSWDKKCILRYVKVVLCKAVTLTFSDSKIHIQVKGHAPSVSPTWSGPWASFITIILEEWLLTPMIITYVPKNWMAIGHFSNEGLWSYWYITVYKRLLVYSKIRTMSQRLLWMLTKHVMLRAIICKKMFLSTDVYVKEITYHSYTVMSYHISA